ncbi:hypothetical protein OG429_23860 [Streptomyces sp. NBC_00190]|uniref:hypothetical protein n=1 Tax=unclassified Streptomyces TaxID=2593676 RepID=UPI002E2DB7E2|nr:hypothetical protein [Streptomyces sp. NBC_00190]
MRTALVLRTSIVTAALAGAMLLPAAGAAFAASAAAPQAAAASDDSRYEGEVHAIGQGLVAVLRNKEEGPEAWIRWVGPEWKPGDPYLVSVVAKLDRTRTSDKVGDVYLELTEAESAKPVLVVTRGGVAKSYPLPAGQAAAECRVGPKQESLGAGVSAYLYFGEYGPEAYLFHSGDDRGFARLDRDNPALPDAQGIIVRIVNPSGAAPVLEWKTQGGADAPFGRTSFPAFPKGCKPKYTFANDKTVEPSTPAPKPSATASTPAGKKAQTTGQTTVVPKGPVAAGAELPVETAAGTGNTATMAAGAGLIAAFGALGASVVLRRRRAQG